MVFLILNLGTCKILDNKRNCECDIGWVGEFCQNINCSIKDICGKNGIKIQFLGKCISNNSIFGCECNFGWTGVFCELEICGNETLCGPSSIFISL